MTSFSRKPGQIVRAEAHAHGKQIAVGQDYTLGLTRSAGSIKKPGRTLRLNIRVLPSPHLRREERFVVQQLPGRFRGCDEVPRFGHLFTALCQRFIEFSGSNDCPGPCVVDDERKFLGMQPEVDGNHGASQLERGIQRLEHLRAIIHQNRHPVTAPQPKMMQRGSQLRGPPIEIPVRERSMSEHDGWMIGKRPGRPR